MGVCSFPLTPPKGWAHHLFQLNPLSVTTLTQLWNFSSCVSLNLIQLPNLTSVAKILHVSRQQRNCHCARKWNSLWEFFCASVMWIYLPTVFKTMCFPRLNTVWILESKTKSKSVFPLRLQDIGQPLILPFRRCLILKYSDATEPMSITFYCESWPSQTLPGYSDASAICLAFLKLSFTALAWGILKLCSWRRLSSQAWKSERWRVSWLSLPFVSLRHWGTDVSVILGWVNWYVPSMGKTEMLCCRKQDALKRRDGWLWVLCPATTNKDSRHGCTMRITFHVVITFASIWILPNF